MKKSLTIVLILTFVVAILSTCFFVVQSKIYPIKYTDEIKQYSTRFQLSPSLVASVVNTESSFNKNAESNKGAIGLMQIKLSTAKFMIQYYKLNIEISKEQLFDVSKNLYFGCMYLKYLTLKFKNIDTALASYNAGETVVRNWLKNENYSNDNQTLKLIPYNETNNYVLKVNKNLKFYKKIFKN